MPTVTPELLAELSAIHARVVAAHRDLDQAMRAARTREHELVPELEAYDLLALPNTNDQIASITYRFRERLIRIAEAQFSPSQSARFSIPRADLTQAFPSNDSFDAAALWAHLEATYKPVAAKSAFADVARKLIDAFNLERNPKIERKGNALVLNKWVSCEKSFSGKTELSYHSSESVVQAFLALAGFAEWAGASHVAAQIRAYLNRTHFHHLEIASRERVTLAAGELEVVTFQTRFEFRFGGALAKQLPIFVGQFARKAA